MNKILRHHNTYFLFFIIVNIKCYIHFQNNMTTLAAKVTKLMRPVSKAYFLKIITGCAIFFCSAALFSQDFLERKIQFEKSKELVLAEPDLSIKLATYFLKNNYKTPSLCHLLLAESYYTKSNYKKALEHVFDIDAESISNKDSLKINVLLLKAKITGNLGLNTIAFKYLDEADEIIKNTDDDYIKDSMYPKLLFERIWINQRLNKYNYSLKLLESAKKKDEAVFKTNLFLARGAAYFHAGKYDLAEKNLNDALSEYNKSKIPNTLLQIQIYYNIGKLYSLKKEYSKAISTLKIPLSEAKRLENKALVKDIDRLIAANYFELGEKKEYTGYNHEMMVLWVEVNTNEVEAINLFYKLIDKETKEAYKSKQDEQTVILYSMMVLLAAVILGGMLIYFSNKIKEKHYKEIQNYLAFKNRSENLKASKNDGIKRVNVPTETEEAILEKLKQFELSDECEYINKDMSLAMLASKMDVNTKYLSEIINSHYHDNFNTYINKLRISYIIKKLENDPQYSRYKISYLAEDCGFSSHTSFTNVFKGITGISPITFIRFLENEKKSKKKGKIGNYCIILFSFIALNTYAQNSGGSSKNVNPYQNPDEAIRVGDSMYNNISNPVSVRIKGLSLASDGYTSKRNYKVALEKVLKANELLETFDNKVTKIRILTSIGLKLQQLKVYDEALDYLDQAKVLIDSYPYKDSVTMSTAINYNVKGLIFKEQLSCDIAISYFNKAINEYNKLNEIKYSQISIIKYNIGNCYIQTSEYELAKKNFDESLKYAEQANASSLRAFALKGMALVYRYQGDYAISVKKLQEAISISEGVGDVVLDMAIYNALSNNYSSLGDWKNHRIYNKKYIDAQEQLTVYEREAVSNSVDELIKEENEKLTELNRNFYYKASILGLLIIVAGIIVAYYYKKKKRELDGLRTAIASAREQKDLFTE